MALNIRLSTHVEQKIVERKLDRDQVAQAVIEEGLPPIAQSRVELDGKIYLLRVAFRDDSDERLVITAYVTSKVEKYWRRET